METAGVMENALDVKVTYPLPAIARTKSWPDAALTRVAPTEDWYNAVLLRSAA